MEIITGVERRRRWRAEDKLRIVAEAEQPGACFAAVARRHDVSRGLLWVWRRQVREGVQHGERAGAFLAVQVVPEAPAANAAIVSSPVSDGRPRQSARGPGGSQAGLIEIALTDGTTLRVGPDVGAVALRRVLGVLRR